MRLAGPRYSISSRSVSAARSDMFLRIFSLSASLAPLRAMAHWLVSTFLSTVWMSLSVNRPMSSKTNIRRRISSTSSGSSCARLSSKRPLGRAVGDVEHLGHRLDAAGVLEALAHHARHPALEALFDFADDLGVGVAHRGDAAHDGQPPRLGQAGQDLGAEVRRQVRHDQRDRLRMLVDDVRQQVLAIDVPQEAERHRLDRLADVVERGRRVRAERLLEQRLGQLPGRRRGRPSWGSSR